MGLISSPSGSALHRGEAKRMPGGWRGGPGVTPPDCSALSLLERLTPTAANSRKPKR